MFDYAEREYLRRQSKYEKSRQKQTFMFDYAETKYLRRRRRYEILAKYPPAPHAFQFIKKYSEFPRGGF